MKCKTQSLPDESEESLGDMLIRSLTEAVEAYESGDPASYPGVTVTVVEVCAPPTFDAAEIRVLRERTGLNHAMFAALVGGSTLTVKRWEKGTAEPNATARRLLQFIRESPERTVGRVVTRRRGRSASLA